MVDLLPRRKPHPLPQITAVPEQLATGTLKTVYEETKAALGVPWMGVVAMAFAHYPTFYRTLWDAMAPVVSTAEFVESCEILRSVAEKAAASLTPPDVTARLHGIGYSKLEIDEIRACNEVFSAGNMPYLLMATRARLLLEGHDWPRKPGTPQDIQRTAHARPELVELHHASHDLQVLYEDIQETLGLPFVNTDYRAFARWPSYFEAAWSDLKPKIAQRDYEAKVKEVHSTAAKLAQALPNPASLSASALQDAAESEEGSVERTVQLFQWLLPGLALNVAFFRHQLIA